MPNPVRLAVAQAGDLVISTYSYGASDTRSVRMRTEPVKKATPKYIWIAGYKFARATGYETGSGSRRKWLVDPTPENLKLVAECDAEWKAKAAEQEASEQRFKAERAANAKKASDWLCTCVDPEQMDHLLGEQILNDVYDALVREGKIRATEDGETKALGPVAC